MSSKLTNATLLAESKKTKRELNTDLIFCISQSPKCVGFGYGDMMIMHNIAIAFMSFKSPPEYVKRFHIVSRTMRRNPDWSWVKHHHLLSLCEVMADIAQDDTSIDDFRKFYYKMSIALLEHYEESVEQGNISEKNYLDTANGFKKPMDFINSEEFIHFAKSRAKFYHTYKDTPLSIIRKTINNNDIIYLSV
jgi:hypothetical protein